MENNEKNQLHPVVMVLIVAVIGYAANFLLGMVLTRLYGILRLPYDVHRVLVKWLSPVMSIAALFAGAYCCGKIIKVEKFPVVRVLCICAYCWLVNYVLNSTLISRILGNFGISNALIPRLLNIVYLCVVGSAIVLVLTQPQEKYQKLFRMVLGCLSAFFIFTGLVILITGAMDASGSGDLTVSVCSVCRGAGCSRCDGFGGFLYNENGPNLLATPGWGMVAAGAISFVAMVCVNSMKKPQKEETTEC